MQHSGYEIEMIKCYRLIKANSRNRHTVVLSRKNGKQIRRNEVKSVGAEKSKKLQSLSARIFVT